MARKKQQLHSYLLRSFIALFVFSLLFLAGCSLSKKPAQQVNDPHSGTEGLLLEFVKNAPPAQVFESSLFPVLVNVKNKGAYNVPSEAALFSLGVERDYTRTLQLETTSRIISGETDNEALFSLEGKSISNSKGDEDVISYSIEAATIDPQSETHKSLLFATLCYPYRTELTTSVCIDTDPSNLRPIKKSCSQTDLNFGSGQGAPVAITSIQVLMLPSIDRQTTTPQFLITVENRGRGEVAYIQSYKDVCRRSAKRLTYEDFNTIVLKASLSGNELQCTLRELTTQPISSSSASTTPSSIVRLKQKKDVIRCVAKDGIPLTQESFISPLRVELDYGYTQSISTEYTIRRPLR